MIFRGVLLLLVSIVGWFVIYRAAVARYPELSLNIKKSVEQTPTRSLIPIPTLPPVNQAVVGTSTTNKPSQVDCVGPDGIQFKTTQAECDNLNSAWNKPSPTTQPSNTDYLYPRLKTYPLYIPPTSAPYPTVQLLPTIPPYQPLPTRPPANVYWHPNPPAPTVPYGFSN